MKGPFERLKYDLRRVFECPACHHKERVDSTQTVVVCRCQTKLPVLEQVVMKLVEDQIQRRFPIFVPPVEEEPEKKEAQPVEASEPDAVPVEATATSDEPASDTPTPSEGSPTAKDAPTEN